MFFPSHPALSAGIDIALQLYYSLKDRAPESSWRVLHAVQLVLFFFLLSLSLSLSLSSCLSDLYLTHSHTLTLSHSHTLSLSLSLSSSGSFPLSDLVSSFLFLLLPFCFSVFFLFLSPYMSACSSLLLSLGELVTGDWVHRVFLRGGGVNTFDCVCVCVCVAVRLAVWW